MSSCEGEVGLEIVSMKVAEVVGISKNGVHHIPGRDSLRRKTP